MLKFFTSDLRRNLTKILCLTVGLAVGFLLVAKIYFQETVDTFFPDIDRMYLFTQSAVNQGEYQEWSQMPGGTATELQRHFPQIEVATRSTYLSGSTSLRLPDGRMLDVDAIVLADTCHFDVLATPIIEGNPHDVLATANSIMIPRSLAEKIGGDVVGLEVTNIAWSPDLKIIIGGVYEDYPLNSTIDNAAYISMPSISNFMHESSWQNMLGNDRYRAFALLAPNTDLDNLHEGILKHLKTILPDDTFRISDYKVWLRPLKGRYSSQDGIKMMTLMLSLLALVMLMCAGLNYLLIVIGQLSARGKEMAIRKCYGTSRGRLFARVMGESLFFLVISLGLAILLAFSFSDLCKELLGYTPQQLFSTGAVWAVELAVCLALFVITGVIPAIIYCCTPVSHAFHPSTRGRKGWKLALLALQFFATGLVMCLLVIVGRQYYLLGHSDLGYEYENIGIFMRNDLTDNQASTIIKELKRLSCVEGVATTEVSDLSSGASGNMMWTEGQYDNQVNVADMYGMNPELVDVLGLRIIQGRNFNLDADSTINEVIVEKRMIPLLQEVFGVKGDDIVGENFYITGHYVEGVGNPLMTIVGVIDDIHRGGFEYSTSDRRPGVLFPTGGIGATIYVRFNKLTPENLREAQKVIDGIKGNSEVYIMPYKARIEMKRDPVRRYGTSVMVVGIAIILIALIGLIGYVADEVNRRAKEIAIRKVNGTPAAAIVHLFCIDILRVALPSLIAGGAVAMVIGRKWLEQFMQRVGLSPLSMILCLLVLTAIITGVVIINSLRVARSNPVNHLRSE